MKKAEQIAINEKCVKIAEMIESSYCNFGNGTKLRSCSAEVYHISNGFVLKSYNTVVAFIDNSGILYDILRYVYGYTSTSAQHIAKFGHDYGERMRYVWREV